jgi:hypothetical protein
MGDMQFTLGLSGWTANDWSHAGQFDLMAPRAQVSDDDKQKVLTALKHTWMATADQLSTGTGLERATVLGALGLYIQAGRAVLDLHTGLYHFRELSNEPLPLKELRFANEKEAEAAEWACDRNVQFSKQDIPGVGLELKGIVKSKKNVYHPVIVIDADERLSDAHCDCNYYNMNKLYKGPCEHMIALRMVYSQKII